MTIGGQRTMSGTNLVTISCSNHHEELVTKLWSNYLSGQGTDFHVHVGGRSIRAHQIILELFLSPHKLGLHAVKDAQDHGAGLSSVYFDGLLEFIYKGSVTVEQEQLDQLLKLAIELDFQMLVAAIESIKSGKLDVPSVRRQRKGKPVKRLNCNVNNDNARSSGKNGDDRVTSNTPQTLPPRERLSRSSTSKDNSSLGGAKNKSGDRGMDEFNDPTNKKSPRLLTKANDADDGADHSDPGNVDDAECFSAESVDGTYEDKINTTNNSRTILKCHLCSYHTTVALRLQNHLARRHDPTVSQFQCESCNKTFRNRTLLANHMLIHANRPAVYSCPSCPYNTPAAKNYNHHMRSAHEVNSRGEPSPKRYSCVDCAYTCIYPNKLRLHRQAVHSTAKNFMCNQCDYRTNLKTSLRRHEKVTHLKIRPHLCHTCGFSTVSQSHLAKHLRMHSGLKPHVCGICDARYASRDAYKSHVRRHEVGDEKPFICHVCGYSCNRKDNLRVHLRKVHDRQAM